MLQLRGGVLCQNQKPSMVKDKKNNKYCEKNIFVCNMEQIHNEIEQVIRIIRAKGRRQILC